MLSLEHVACYLPPNLADLESEYETIGISKLHARIYKTYFGLARIPVATGLTIIDLVANALAKLINTMQIEVSNIKYLIYAHTAAGTVPFGDSLIRNLLIKFNLNKALAFSMTMNKCASMLQALEVAAYLFAGEERFTRAIIITGDKAFTPELRSLQNASITGDAAAAVLINNFQLSDQLLTTYSKTYGKYAKGGWTNSAEGLAFEREFIAMLVATINHALIKSQLTIDLIKIILPHNVNIPVWQQVAKALNICFSKIYIKNIPLTAHCFTSDFLINYQSLLNDQLLNSGDYYLAVSVGFGVTFSAAIFRH